jgi:hypothetical protein
VTEQPSNQIASELCDAFWRAIGAYRNWRPGQPVPEVSLRGKQITISSICELVAKHNDRMPEQYWELLTSLASPSEEPPTESFASGARFLQMQISDKQHRFNIRPK